RAGRPGLTRIAVQARTRSSRASIIAHHDYVIGLDPAAGAVRLRQPRPAASVRRSRERLRERVIGGAVKQPEPRLLDRWVRRKRPRVRDLGVSRLTPAQLAALPQ